LICNVQGQDKSGKTYWVLATCPKPAWYICWDPNGEEIAKKLVREQGLDIRIDRYAVPDRDQKQDFHADQWKRFQKSVDAVYKTNEGTLFIDTFTEVYDAVRLAYFGKLTGGKARNYGGVFADLNDIVNSGYQSDMNLVISHKMTKEYVRPPGQPDGEGAWNGNYIPDGWKNAPYAVQANFELMYDPAVPGGVADKMRVYVKNNNQAMWMNGWALPAEMGGRQFTQSWFDFQTMLDWTFEMTGG
jgi:hypothetical protein